MILTQFKKLKITTATRDKKNRLLKKLYKMNTFKALFILVIIFCSPSVVLCQVSSSQKSDITAYVKKTMQELEISGAAMAVVKNNQVVYKNYFGKANLEYDIPISESSLFRLHSLSKVFVSVGVFQLIEQGKIDLEDKISTYLSDLPNEWKNIQIKHLLTHSSGLPDMRDETNLSEEVAAKNVYQKEIQFPFGERASYNQTNFWLLNRIIRKITNGSFQDYISKQFKENAKVSFSNVLDIIPNRVMEYKPNNKGKLQNFHFVVPQYMYGAGGITMTLEDLINWDQKLYNNTLLNADSKNKMFSPFQYKIGKGFSYGWDIRYLNGNVSYGFNGGGLVNYRIFPTKGISVIWFTNGYRKSHNIDNITNRIAGFIDKDLIDKTPEFAKSLAKIVSSNKSKNLAKAYQKLKKEYLYIAYENVINIMGYQFLKKKQIHNAIALFKLNTEEFPLSANTYDSLAEGYYYNGEFELSKQNYLKSLDLNPSNANATKMLTKIKNKSQE